MIRRIRSAGVVLLLAALLIGCTGGSKIVAKVNEDTITERNLAVAAGLRGFGQEQSLDLSDETVRKVVLAMLAEEHLLLQEASRRQLTPDMEEVKSFKQLFRERYSEPGATSNSVAERALSADLKQYGVTVADLDQYLERLSLLGALGKHVEQSVSVSADEVRQFYEENPQFFATPEEVRASHILIQTNEDRTAEEAEAEIRALAAELKEHPDRFAALAEAHSEDPGSAVRGGDLDFFPRGAMVPQFEETAFGTPVGEMAEPVQTDYGWHLILVTDSREAGMQPLEAVASQIEMFLQGERSNELVETLLTDLKKNATYEPANLFEPPPSS